MNAALTPTVNALAEKGTRFTRHHAVYPTVTRVNAAAMLSGCYPGKHGIPANHAVFPDHDPGSAMGVLQPELSAMAANPETPVLFVPTIGEILASAGMTHVSIVGGSSGCGYVHFPRAEEAGRGGLIHSEFSLPSELGGAEAEILGPWPGSSVPGLPRIHRVADSACRFVIPEIDPEVLFVWFPEPDGANHAHGVGSDQSNEGLREADAAFGRILDTLSARGDEPDVIVVSDHGYSTISDAVDPASELRAAGFVVDEGEGSVLLGNNGGSVLLNYPGVGESDIEQLMSWLIGQPWAGAVFSSLPAAQQFGALRVEEAFMAGKRAPDFAVSMAWDDSIVDDRLIGTAFNGGHSPAGAGLHGSASPHEIRNTLIASGPSFKRKVDSSVPSGNVDVAPTALSLLGLEVPAHMDGRVLSEALADGPNPQELSVEQDVTYGGALNGTSSAGRYFARKVAVGGRVYLESAGVESA